MLEKIDFNPGKVRFNSIRKLKNDAKVKELPKNWLDEDVFTVEYPYGYGMDAGWYGYKNGKFKVRIFSQAFDNMITEKGCKTFQELKKIVREFHKIILKKIKEEDIKKQCKNCAFFKFSGMSRQMSSGTAGYCFYWMGETGSRVIVRIDNYCPKFKLMPFSRKDDEKSREYMEQKNVISKLRKKYSKKSGSPKKIKLPIRMAKK
jgi:hypothetical protein